MRGYFVFIKEKGCELIYHMILFIQMALKTLNNNNNKTLEYSDIKIVKICGFYTPPSMPLG